MAEAAVLIMVSIAVDNSFNTAISAVTSPADTPPAAAAAAAAFSINVDEDEDEDEDEVVIVVFKLFNEIYTSPSVLGRLLDELLDELLGGLLDELLDELLGGLLDELLDELLESLNLSN
jgi:hypothetical protein